MSNHLKKAFITIVALITMLGSNPAYAENIYGNIQLASLSSNANRTSFGNSIDDMGYDSIY